LNVGGFNQSPHHLNAHDRQAELVPFNPREIKDALSEALVGAGGMHELIAKAHGIPVIHKIIADRANAEVANVVGFHGG
jgi:hypothetical protein